jgi:hypothetical protein
MVLTIFRRIKHTHLALGVDGRNRRARLLKVHHKAIEARTHKPKDGREKKKQKLLSLQRNIVMRGVWEYASSEHRI